MTPPVALREFATDVRDGLCRHGQKSLPPKYFYDDLGSALFDAITLLPEYGLTRADERVIQRAAPELARRFAEPVTVAELGSGTGRKTRRILEAFRARQPEIDYYAIDVSRLALDACRRELAPLARIVPLECTYLEGLQHLAECRHGHQNLLVLFLGSTIGNFERVEALRFLTAVRKLLRTGDGLLLGADLLKPSEALLAAYDDPLGVTASFNLNVLARINRELGASFDLGRFHHLAVWNESEQRVEMHLQALEEHGVEIPGAECTARFAEGETIWTESSHKYTHEDLAAMAAHAGFRFSAEWTDEEWPFTEALWTVE